MSVRSLFLIGLRLLVGGVFIAAAVPKILDPQAFADSIRGYRVVGPLAGAWIALFMPWLELVLGTGILLPSLRRISGLMIAALLLLFMALHVSAWMRGLNVECGCFGAAYGAQPNLPWLLLRNGILLAATAVLLNQDLASPSGLKSAETNTR